MYVSTCLLHRWGIHPEVNIDGIHNYIIIYRSKAITGLAVSTWGHLMVSGSEDGSTKVWDIASHQTLKTVTLKGEYIHVHNTVNVEVFTGIKFHQWMQIFDILVGLIFVVFVFWNKPHRQDFIKHPLKSTPRCTLVYKLQPDSSGIESFTVVLAMWEGTRCTDEIPVTMVEKFSVCLQNVWSFIFAIEYSVTKNMKIKSPWKFQHLHNIIPCLMINSTGGL